MLHKSITQFSNQLVRLRPVIDVCIFCAKLSPPRTTALSEAGPRPLPTKQATTRVYLLYTLFSIKWRRSKVAVLAHKDMISKWWWSWHRLPQNSEHNSPELVSLGQPVTNAAPSCAHKWRGFESNLQIPMNIFVASHQSLQADFCNHKERVLSPATCTHHRCVRHITQQTTIGEKTQCLSRHEEFPNLLNPALLWHTSALVSPQSRKSPVLAVHESRASSTSLHQKPDTNRKVQPGPG